MQPSTDKQNESKDGSGTKRFIRMSGFGFMILAQIAAGWFVGQWIDSWLGRERPLWAIVLSVLMIVVALYQFIKQALKN